MIKIRHNLGTVMSWLYWSQWWALPEAAISPSLAEFEVETTYAFPKWMQVALVVVTIAVYPKNRFLVCFQWDTLVLLASKCRTFTSCKFIMSFKIRLKQKEQEHVQNSDCCCVLLGCFSFLCSFFPFLPLFSTPYNLLVVCTLFCFGFCSCHSILLSTLFCVVCGFPVPHLLRPFLFPACFWAAVSFHSAMCAKPWSQTDLKCWQTAFRRAV